MTCHEFWEITASVRDRADNAGDRFCLVYFSRQEDAFQGLTSDNFDAGDALLVITKLVRTFGLSPEALALMDHSDSTLDG